MSDHVLSRKATIFTAVVFAITLTVAVTGALGVPPHAWAWMIAHHSPTLIMAADVWGLIPGVLAFVLVINPYGGRLNRRRPLLPDRQLWSDRVFYVIGPYMIVGQALVTLGLNAYWNPTLKHLLGGDPHAPQFLGLADPHQLISRVWLIGAGTLCMWFGNGIPKFMIAVRGGRQEPENWNRSIRARGWIWVLGGAAMALCAVFLPVTQNLRATVLMILAAMILSSIGIRLVLRTDSQPPTGAAPPKGS